MRQDHGNLCGDEEACELADASHGNQDEHCGQRFLHADDHEPCLFGHAEESIHPEGNPSDPIQGMHELVDAEVSENKNQFKGQDCFGQSIAFEHERSVEYTLRFVSFFFHPMKKATTFPVLSAFLLLLAACNPAANTPPAEDENDSSSSTEDMTIEDDDASNDDDDMVGGDASTSVAPTPPPPVATQPRVIAITTNTWVFTPNMITAKQGEKVTIQLTGIAGTHGFSSPELGISAMVTPGQTISVTLPTDVAGTFKIFCNIPCGAGHKDMVGTIVIQA